MIIFSEMSAVLKTENVYCTKRTTILQHTETIIWSRKVPSNISYGKQRICPLSIFFIVISKEVKELKGRLTPIKILNKKSCSIDLYKEKSISYDWRN